MTKVNGKLVMARTKPKPIVDSKTLDLLGEAFGIDPVRKRSISVAANVPEPVLIGGIPYVPGPAPPHSAPISQQPFPQLQHAQGPFSQGPVMIQQLPNQQPLTYGAPPNAPNPTPQDFEHLKRIDAHFNRFVVPTLSEQASNVSRKNTKTATASKTTITITKHICANCGRLRSRRYHHEHPISPGKEPAPEFCGKCQRDVSCTDTEDSERELKRKEKKSKHKKVGKEKQRVSSTPTYIDSESVNHSCGRSMSRALARRSRHDLRYEVNA